MASLRGERSIAELCREHQISESLLRRWRDVALEVAAERLAGAQERSVQGEQRKRIAELEAALGTLPLPARSSRSSRDGRRAAEPEGHLRSGV